MFIAGYRITAEFHYDNFSNNRDDIVSNEGLISPMNGTNNTCLLMRFHARQELLLPCTHSFPVRLACFKIKRSSKHANRGISLLEFLPMSTLIFFDSGLELVENWKNL